MDTKAFEQTHYRIEKESIDLRKACEETCQAIDRKRDEPMAKVVRKPNISAAMAERIRLWQASMDSKQKVSAKQRQVSRPSFSSFKTTLIKRNPAWRTVFLNGRRRWIQKGNR